MRRKLMAVAVAGALAAPAIADAQSTVQIYGRVTYEYGIADGGRQYGDTDYADTPGGSAIGFKGVETLGGGLSAWFQCETSADIRGFDTIGLCSRNSAVGLRGGFGNIFFGKWDTPMKRALNIGTVGSEETGILGMSFLPWGGSGGTSTSPTASGSGGLLRERFKRRETCLGTYETPNMGGFQVMAAMTCKNRPFDEALTEGVANSDTRVWSVAATYVAGPLGIGVAYERHKNFGALGSPALGAEGLDDRGYGASAAYTFGPVKLGVGWLRRKFEQLDGNLRKDTAVIGIEWDLGGPHGIEAQYAYAWNTKGSSDTRIAGRGGIPAAGSGTGGKAWTVGYVYDFSKRTSVKLAYTRVDNDKNTNLYYLGNAPRPIGNGQALDSYGFIVKHNF